MKTFIFLILVLSASASSAQDGIFWQHDISFQFSTKLKKHQAVFFYANQAYRTKACHAQLRDSNQLYYRVLYSCSGIGSESQVKKIRCPDIYLAIQHTRTRKGKKINLPVRQVLFVFETAPGPMQKIQIGPIKLRKLLRMKEPVITVDRAGNYKAVKRSDLAEKPSAHYLVRFEKAKT